MPLTRKLPPFKINKGGLRRSLKVEKDFKFTIPELDKLRKMVERGKPFTYRGTLVIPTLKLRRQIIFGRNLMKMQENWRKRTAKKKNKV